MCLEIIDINFKITNIMLSEICKTNAQFYINSVREFLDTFEKELDNIDDRGYNEQLYKHLTRLYARASVLVEDIECAKVWN